MRVRKKSGALSVHAIAGTEVVLLGLNITAEARQGLLGFTIERYDRDNDRKYVLRGGKRFPGVAESKQKDSSTAPIQSFLWGDYAVDPGVTYGYKVRAQYGSPGNLVEGDVVEVEVTTETQEDTTHAIFFNRGVAGSQAYSRRFERYRKYYLTEKYGKKSWGEFISPQDVPGDAAWKWLSRGLEEAMLAFIHKATGPAYGLRAAVYEFTYKPVLEAFANAVENGADVKIIHHAKHKTRTPGKPLDEVGQAAQDAIEHTGLKSLETANRWWDLEKDVPNSELFIERTQTSISHNKFIIFGTIDPDAAQGEDPFTPLEVWTGSTNLTAGGIFGQSNVGHIVRDKQVAQKYYAYWQVLRDNPAHDEALKKKVEAIQADLTDLPAPGIITIFSPRTTDAMLGWYADRLGKAKTLVCFTAAFGVAQLIGEKLIEEKVGTADNPYLSYILLEKKDSEKKSQSAKESAAKDGKPIPLDYYDFFKHPQNRIAWGDILRNRHTQDSQPEFLDESLSGLNTYVDYLHTKYMLIDPLTDDPIVISGSANFSENSTTSNDENMLIIRGNTRVADIFLTEFMRLFNHFRRRNEINALPASEAEDWLSLTTDDSWTAPYFQVDEQLCQQRLLFSKSHK